MSKEREVLKLALEALEGLIKKTGGQSIYSFMETERRIAMSACVGIKEALAQPEQEPVAVVAEVHMSRYTIEWTNGPLPEDTKLYTIPPQRKPLTDEEITQVFGVGYVAKEFVEFVRAIEAAHGIKGE